MTKPTPPFTAPPPAPAEPPAAYHSTWYGTPHLWTMLHPEGEVWPVNGLPHDSTSIGQKTFWWSADWKLDAEPSPSITVSGIRLDGGGTFGVAGGTNAIADFGAAMLVGVEFPFAGCWQLTARYHGATLSYVVWLKP